MLIAMVKRIILRFRRRIAVGASVCTIGMLFILASNQPVFDTRRYIEARLEGPLLPDDPAVLEELRNRYLVPPSLESYMLYDNNILDENNLFKEHFSYKFYKDVLEQLFVKANRSSGFFIEAGAMDGEWGSNTLMLEKQLKWNGLLVEPDTEMFMRLLKKNRKCWAANICLSPHPYAYKDILRKQSSDNHHSDIVLKNVNSLMMSGFAYQEPIGYTTYEAVQCFPIESVLLALGVTNITVFSLDVEDVEWGILRQFPFASTSVSVWLVEHNRLPQHDGGRSATYDPDFVKWFKDRGYRLFAYMEFVVVDYVFVHENSVYGSISYKDTGLQDMYNDAVKRTRTNK